MDIYGLCHRQHLIIASFSRPVRICYRFFNAATIISIIHQDFWSIHTPHDEHLHPLPQLEPEQHLHPSQPPILIDKLMLWFEDWKSCCRVVFAWLIVSSMKEKEASSKSSDLTSFIPTEAHMIATIKHVGDSTTSAEEHLDNQLKSMSHTTSMLKMDLIIGLRMWLCLSLVSTFQLHQSRLGIAQSLAWSFARYHTDPSLIVAY